MKLDNIKISNHAKERYAERIMDREDTTQVAAYILTESDKIRDDICKMIQYGSCIYAGINMQKEKPFECEIYLSGTWIVICSVKDNTVVTLYKIDLGLGEDFNKEYVVKLTEKLDEANAGLKKVRNEIAESRQHYDELIKQNEESITEYKSLINNLTKLNNDYKAVVEDMDVRYAEEDVKVKKILNSLIGRKVV